MPYIDKKLREYHQSYIPTFGSAGELNYLITQLCLRYLQSNTTNNEFSYHIFNAIVGALECAKLEMYRRMVAPYEDNKCKENSDVYPKI